MQCVLHAAVERRQVPEHPPGPEPSGGVVRPVLPSAVAVQVPLLAQGVPVLGVVAHAIRAKLHFLYVAAVRDDIHLVLFAGVVGSVERVGSGHF